MYYEFSTPDKFKETIKKLVAPATTKTPREKFESFMQEMQQMTPQQLKTDERTKELAKVIEDIEKQIQ
jgi:hypothetical protein